jgi:hypothetical protein
MIEGFIKSKVEALKKAMHEFQATHPHNRLTNATFDEGRDNRLIHADLGDVDLRTSRPLTPPPEQS